MGSEIVVLINASSGAEDKKPVVEKLHSIFARAGIVARIRLIEAGENIDEAARHARQDNPRVIVAGGGDGTISAVASTLVDTQTALGVLPLGTLNHFAKALEISMDVEQAAQTIIDGRIATVDVGEVNGRIFLNNSSLGLYPRIVRFREQQQERLGRSKWAAFAWALVTVMRRHAFLRLRLRADGIEVVRRTPFVFVGNNQYEMEGLNIGRRACLDAGLLSVYMSNGIGRWGVVRLGFQALLGRLRQAKDFDAACLKEFQIDTSHRQLRVATDGEITRMEAPLLYRIRPGALKVLAPAKSSAR